MPVTYDLYGDRSGNTRNVLVEPNRVSWLKRHFARIRYGPRSGTGRIPFCRRAAWYGRCVHPTSTLWRSNCLLGSGSGAPNGLVCYSANRRSAGQFGTPELLITDLIGNKEHSQFKGYIPLAASLSPTQWEIVICPIFDLCRAISQEHVHDQF